MRTRPASSSSTSSIDDALRTADRLTTYRQICAQVAREFNIIACFMCKPFMGVSANGCHHNISLWKGGKDEFKHARQRSEEPAGPGAQLTCTAAAARTPSCPTAGDVQLPGQIGL